ncbi:MAG: DUF6492 family protein, partial [Woeseiaceae bacterium]
MICDILIRSYWRDFAWLEYCLRSIEQHCSGFRVVILAIPERSVPWLNRWPPLPSGMRLEICPNYPDDYLGQQVTKLHADEVTDADLICHVDSDCIFVRPTSPHDLAPGGLPLVYMRPVGELPRHWPWTRPTADFLGWQPAYDFMQHPPFVFPRWLYAELRDWSRRKKAVELADWVLSRPPRGFSECNALAAYAHAFRRDAFTWISADDGSEERRVCRWYWS